MAIVEARSTDRILHKALDLFSSKGYDATSVREICEAAEITKPTLYHFYGSKEGVYRALIDGTLHAFHEKLQSDLAAPGSIEDRLRRMARGYFANARDHRELMRFIMRIIHNPPASAPATDFVRFYDDVVQQVARVVDDGVASGSLRPGPTDIRLLVLMGALGESLCGFLVAGRPELTDALADALVASILDGWRCA
jgi:TetR/AcrR family transcriptional regulator